MITLIIIACLIIVPVCWYLLSLKPDRCDKCKSRLIPVFEYNDTLKRNEYVYHRCTICGHKTKIL